MSADHSLDSLKKYHNESMQFFASELILLKETIPRIKNDRLGKAAMLLISGGQTGAALLQLANQVDTFTSESVMLARSFMEKIINFCYVCVCDEKEYRRFILHPVYKHYHNVGAPKIEDDLDTIAETIVLRRKKQEELKKISIVQEALSIFSETKENLNWTKKTLDQRIKIIKDKSMVLDVFFTINKIQYYSDASEALHGSLYGSTYNLGFFDIDHTKKEELYKKLYKDNTCVLLHIGMLIHEALTLISYSEDIQDIWKLSYQNRRHGLNLLFHVLGKKSKFSKS